MRVKALNDLKELKRIINSNDKAQLSKFALTLNKDTYYINSLKSIFDVCNIDDINWTQKEGLNKVSIDNGDAISIYYIKFTNTQVILSEGRIQHSEIFGDYGDGYSSYESEGEYVTWYFFSIGYSGLN
ncbi:hypothetical protein [Myroides marinus]|uniref:hypothetical protein n=1 Tax=Myroides marinus TaxID=703342 RepID=UPI0025764D3C|nr:hypothetical protein [Myroides marinus]MDM1534584.1 hypothetical protein [Myroides marinus]MDM1541546.1 hypothetical protein [Myroides marinus]